MSQYALERFANRNALPDDLRQEKIHEIITNHVLRSRESLLRSLGLSDPSSVYPTFTPDAVGDYVIQLIVTDAAGLSSAPATVTISTVHASPVADAVFIINGSVVQFNGSQSYDPAGLSITYQWTILSKPVERHATLTGPTTATPSFTADVLGDYSIQLVVTDSVGTASSPAMVNLSFKSFIDVAPVANAGPSQSAVVGQTVTLNGSGSTDSDGQPLTYKWSIVSAPSGSTAAILNPTAQIASFVPICQVRLWCSLSSTTPFSTVFLQRPRYRQ